MDLTWRPLKLAIKTRGKNSAINSRSSIKIWHKFQILKGLAGPHDLDRDVIHAWFQDWRDFADEDPNLWSAKIGQNPASQKFRQCFDQVKIAAPADVHDDGGDLGIIQSVFKRVGSGRLGGPGRDFHINREPLLHGSLLGSDPNSGNTVDAGDENLVHLVLHVSLSSSGSRPAKPVSTSCQYRIVSSPNCQQR